MEQNPKEQMRIVFMVIGGILALIALMKMRVIGIYPREAPLYFGMLIAAMICFYLAKKIKIVKDGDDSAGLSLPDKWKCSCGSYNGKDEDFCGNCGVKRPASQAL